MIRELLMDDNSYDHNFHTYLKEFYQLLVILKNEIEHAKKVNLDTNDKKIACKLLKINQEIDKCSLIEMELYDEVGKFLNSPYVLQFNKNTINTLIECKKEYDFKNDVKNKIKEFSNTSLTIDTNINDAYTYVYNLYEYIERVFVEYEVVFVKKSLDHKNNMRKLLKTIESM